MEKFIDRELSALEFNARVLSEAMAPAHPVLERLKFLGIVSGNLDEFFMVRIASLKAAKAPLQEIREKAKALLQKCNDYFLQTLAPEMEAAGLARLQPESCNPVQMEFLSHFFRKEVLPVLTPIAIADDRPLPVLSNLRLHWVAGLADSPQGGREGAGVKSRKYAVVEIPPKIFPRLVFLPSEKGHPFVLMEDVIGAFAAELFAGHEIVEKGVMRLTRGAELTFDEEKDEDFLRVMTEALRDRPLGDIVRMEASADESWTQFLKKKLSIAPDDVAIQSGPLDLKSISQLAVQPGFESLKRPV